MKKIFLLFVITLASAFATDYDALAKHLISVSNRPDNPRGVCAVPQGGELAFAFVENSGYYVVSQEATQELQQKASGRASKDGLLETRMSIAEADWKTSVLADSYANLYILTDMTDAKLRQIKPDDIVKKLAPHGGQLIIGGKTEKASLEGWIKSAELITDHRSLITEFGTYLIATRPELRGSVEWTHRFYKAHNNPVSEDTAFKWPPVIQWVEKPFHDGGSLSLMAGGRVYIVFSGYGSKAARVPNNDATRNIILVRDAYNGRELWRYEAKDKSAGIERRMSALVALTDVCYLAEPKTRTVREFDAETGKELRSFELAGEGEEVKWIAVENGILCTLSGPLDERQTSGDQWRWFNRQYRGMKASKDGDPYAIDRGSKITAVDLKTGKELWQFDDKAPAIHETCNALFNGRMYTFSEDSGLHCLDLKSGKEIWHETAVAPVWKEMAEKRTLGSFGHNGGLLVSEKAGIVYVPNIGALVFSSDTGKELWHFRGPYHPLIKGERVFTASGACFDGDKEFGNTVLNLMTGKEDLDYIKKTFPKMAKWRGKVPIGSACGSISQSPFFHAGSWGMTFDFNTNRLLPKYNDHRNNCNGVGLFAEGMFFNQAYECTCSYKLRGQVMEITDPDLPRTAEADEKLQLRQTNLSPLGLQAGSDDWPTQRGSYDRNAASSAEIPGNVKQKWQSSLPKFDNPGFYIDAGKGKGAGLRTPDAVYLPVPPVAARDTAYSGSADGTVSAMDLKTGNTVWQFHTGGQLFTSPSYWKGTLLVGSADGYVYSLDAQTGKERWRFQAAPSERRIFVYGHLSSTWPVACSVTVHEGKAYVGASFQSSNGSYLYSLDAETGKLIWQKPVGTKDMNTLAGGKSLLGLTVAAGGKLWFGNTGFSLENGDGGGNEWGPFIRYTGKYDDDTIVSGGWRFFGNQLEWQNVRDKNGHTGLNFRSISQKTKRGLKRALFIHKPIGFAAWDKDGMVSAAKGERVRIGRKSKWVKPQLMFWRTEEIIKVRDEHFKRPDPRPIPLPEQKTKEELVAGGTPTWRVSRDGFAGCALSKDHAIALVRKDVNIEKQEYSWHVSAFSRKDGKEAWSIDLPSIPLMDGLAIAHDGTVLVQLLDGSIAGIGK